MGQTIEAVYDGEVLRLTEPLTLQPNTRVRITVESVVGEPDAPTSFLQTALELRLEGPPDWAENLDEYLYGEPDKRDA